MIGIVATLKIQEGKNAGFESFFTDLSNQVSANEPGNVMYKLFKHKKDPQTYIIMEQYQDDDAVNAHRNSDHFKAAGAKFGEFLAGKPVIESCEAV